MPKVIEAHASVDSDLDVQAARGRLEEASAAVRTAEAARARDPHPVGVAVRPTLQSLTLDEAVDAAAKAHAERARALRDAEQAARLRVAATRAPARRELIKGVFVVAEALAAKIAELDAFDTDTVERTGRREEDPVMAGVATRIRFEAERLQRSGWL